MEKAAIICAALSLMLLLLLATPWVGKAGSAFADNYSRYWDWVQAQ